MTDILDAARSLIIEHCRRSGVLDSQVEIQARVLSTEEAIGEPGRRDYPIIVGRERMLEASVLGVRGQAFTDSPREFSGTVEEVLSLPLDINRNRAVFVAALNALCAYLGLITKTLHCKDSEPTECSQLIAAELRTGVLAPPVGIIGYNPALLEALSTKFGPDFIRAVDLNPDNIGQQKFGIIIGDGVKDMDHLVAESEIILVTGTTLTNGSLNAIYRLLNNAERSFFLYGVTAAGVAALCHLPHLCPCAHEANS